MNATTEKPRHVVIVAGEASGDLHASKLIEEYKHLDPGIRFSGMGGQKMRATGADIFVDCEDLAVIGLFEVIAKYSQIKAALDQLKAHIDETRPDLLILVDYQEFNQKLAAYAKSIGIKVLFYIGPQVWAWRPKRVHKMARIVDKMAVIFPFEVDLYREADVDVEFTGHPLVDEVVREHSPQEAREALGLSEATTIGIFPGSRGGEVKSLMPIMLCAAKTVRKTHPDIQLVLPIANSKSEEALKPFTRMMDELGVRRISGRTYEVMQACDAIMTASGTATLEIALMEVPMAIIYTISPLSYIILKRMVKLDFIGLANIVSGKEVVREFLQNKAKPSAIAAEMNRIIEDESYRNEIRSGLSKVRHRLGDSGGLKNIARLAYDMVQGTR